jgi:hypothetical protein
VQENPPDTSVQRQREMRAIILDASRPTAITQSLHRLLRKTVLVGTGPQEVEYRHDPPERIATLKLADPRATDSWKFRSAGPAGRPGKMARSFPHLLPEKAAASAFCG